MLLTCFFMLNKLHTNAINLQVNRGKTLIYNRSMQFLNTKKLTNKFTFFLYKIVEIHKNMFATMFSLTLNV